MFQKSLDNRLGTVSGSTGVGLEPVGEPFGITDLRFQIWGLPFEICNL